MLVGICGNGKRHENNFFSNIKRKRERYWARVKSIVFPRDMQTTAVAQAGTVLKFQPEPLSFYMLRVSGKEEYIFVATAFLKSVAILSSHCMCVRKETAYFFKILVANSRNICAKRIKL